MDDDDIMFMVLGENGVEIMQNVQIDDDGNMTVTGSYTINQLNAIVKMENMIAESIGEIVD